MRSSSQPGQRRRLRRRRRRRRARSRHTSSNSERRHYHGHRVVARAASGRPELILFPYVFDFCAAAPVLRKVCPTEPSAREPESRAARLTRARSWAHYRARRQQNGSLISGQKYHRATRAKVRAFPLSLVRWLARASRINRRRRRLRPAKPANDLIGLICHIWSPPAAGRGRSRWRAPIRQFSAQSPRVFRLERSRKGSEAKSRHFACEQRRR